MIIKMVLIGCAECFIGGLTVGLGVSNNLSLPLASGLSAVNVIGLCVAIRIYQNANNERDF